MRLVIILLIHFHFPYSIMIWSSVVTVEIFLRKELDSYIFASNTGKCDNASKDNVILAYLILNYQYFEVQTV
jgi:hypothetical protein